MNQHSYVGQEIDQFQVLSHIARGGMADVYLAEDKELGRRVVLKLMLPELASNDELIARFQREAQTTARLAHPHIVQIYNIGQTANGIPYIALQFIEGGSLGEYLQEAARKGEWISTAYALTLVRQIAAALTAAHNAGIIHRDLKPNNILLRDDGSAILSDLGIAAVQQDTTRLTRTGGILGTPYYMSPEQAVGEKVDGRSDIYSLGVILYELLSKKPPFQADSPWGIVHQHVYEQPVPLDQIRPGLAKETYAIVKTCLQKDPAARYQNAQALEAAMASALHEEGEYSATAPTMIDTMPPEPGRIKSSGSTLIPPKSRPAIFWALLVMIPIACLLASFWGYRQFVDVPFEPTAAVPTEENGDELLGLVTDVPETLDPDEQSWDTPQTPGELTATATRANPTVTPTIWSPTETTTFTPPTATPTPIPPLLGPIDLPGSGIVRMTEDNDNSEFQPILSPDQRSLIFFSDRLGTWQIFSKSSLGGDWNRLTSNDVDNYHPHYSPDGEEIVFASQMSGDWEIYRMDKFGGNVNRLTYRDGPDEYPSFSPDGQWVLYLSKRDNGWGVYATSRDGSGDREVIDSSADETYPVFSPDGQSIVFQSNALGSHDIYTIPWSGGVERQLTTNSARDANPVFSPDGQWIAFESDRSGNYEIYAMKRDGSNLFNVTNNAARDQIPAFSPDGRWLLFQSDREGSWDIFRQSFVP